MRKQQWLLTAMIGLFVAAPAAVTAQKDELKREAENFAGDILKKLFEPSNWDAHLHGGASNTGRFMLQRPFDTNVGERVLTGNTGFSVGGGFGMDILLLMGFRLDYTFSSADLNYRTDIGNGSDIFDIDDVILNALGVLIGYSAFAILANWIRSRNYKKLAVAALSGVAAAAAFYGGVVYPTTHPPTDPPVNPAVDAQRRDLCGGTGGTGQIVSVGNHTITIERNDGVTQTLTLTDRTIIRASAGPVSASDLKTGDRVTVVVYDGETATTVLICRVSDTGSQARRG